jgi:hypothetical protein
MLGDASGGSVVLDGIDVVDVTDAKSQGGGGMGHMYPFDSLVVMKDIVEVTQGVLVDQRSFAIVPLDINDSVASSSNQ